MTKTIMPLLIIDLQLFSEGGEGAGTGATAAVAESQGAVQNAEVAPSAGTTTEVKVDREAEYKKAREDYKDLFDAEMQKIVKTRVKESKETKQTAEKYTALSPMLEMLYNQYGIEAGDDGKLIEAYLNDTKHYAEEAAERGIPTEDWMAMKRNEREVARLSKIVNENKEREEVTKILQGWQAQAEEAQKTFPGLDLKTELENEQFAKLLRSGTDVKTAFQVCHMDEIMANGMKYAVDTAEKKLADNIKANAARPIENGTSSQSAAVSKTDVSNMTAAQIRDIRQRVLRGEKVTF